jgi:hypothetical protein
LGTWKNPDGARLSAISLPGKRYRSEAYEASLG